MTGTKPCAGTAGKYLPPWQDEYQAQAIRRKVKGTVNADIGTGINRAIDWHVHPHPANWGTIGWDFQTETFDANGEVDGNNNALAKDTWHRWLTDNPAPDVSKPESSAYLAANLNFPDWRDEPGDDQAEARGFQISDNWACVRWDVAGGFQLH